jgi:hypothetical protein
MNVVLACLAQPFFKDCGAQTGIVDDHNSHGTTVSRQLLGSQAMLRRVNSKNVGR